MGINKIEQQIDLMKYEKDPHKTIELGSNFYNATLHLKSDEDYYQTNISVRGDSNRRKKEPGYRKFLPINIIDGKYTIYVKNLLIDNGEFVKPQLNQQKYFYGTLENSNDLIPFNFTGENEEQIIEPWNTEDMLPTSDGNKIVIVWMWCRGVTERQGNLLNLLILGGLLILLKIIKNK